MLEISNPTEAELETVLNFAFQHLPPDNRSLQTESMLRQYQSGHMDLRGIFQAKHDGELAGVMYAQSRPEGSVMLWIPAMAKGYSLETMLEPLEQFCLSQNVFAAIALADREQSFDEQTFCVLGQFRFLSDMIHLVAEIMPHEAAEEPYRLNFVPLSEYAEDVSVRLTCLVKETYRNTLDFPDLMQIAPVEKVLQGYKVNTQYRPDLWFFLQKEDADVGVLLLTDVSPEQFELTYMGLIESVRRQGLSREIVRFAKEITAEWHRTLLLTAVDAGNIPACQTYLSQGFKAWDRKKVYVRLFS